MACIDDLDMNQPLVLLAKAAEEEIRKSGTPSPYFEELWRELINCLEDFEARIDALENP